MWKYVVSRIFLGIITLWFVVTITFFLMHSIPGGPFDMAGLETMNPAVRQNMEAKFGLHRPLHEQYGLFLKNLATGELGISISYSPRTVNDIIALKLPVSAKVGGLAIVITVFTGIILGIIAALRQDKLPDQLVKVFTALGITIPSFVVATLLIYVFAVQLRWFPSYGLRSFRHAILPAIAMSLGAVAYLSRLTRSSLLDVIRQDYMRTAKAKGLPARNVIIKHGLKNAMLPIVTFIGPLIMGLLTGTFIIEQIFAIPGMGKEMVSAIGNRDYMMILGLTTFYSILLITTYIIVDIVYMLIDPRIKMK